MKHTVLSIILFAMIVRSCVAAIVVNPLESERRTILYEAAIDILMRCYGDPGKAVGLLGALDDSFVKRLWSNYSIPAVLLDDTAVIPPSPGSAKVYRLQVFVILSKSLHQLYSLMKILYRTIWANSNAKLLIVNAMPDKRSLLSRNFEYMDIANKFGFLNVQYVSVLPSKTVIVVDANPFIRSAPEAWRFIQQAQSHKEELPMSLYAQPYKIKGTNCKDLHFPKTKDIGGYPLYFLVEEEPFVPISTAKYISGTSTLEKVMYGEEAYNRSQGSHTVNEATTARTRAYHWFIDNIMIAMNASAMITNDYTTTAAIVIVPFALSFAPERAKNNVHLMILSRNQLLFVAITNHTAHKSQLMKILSVIDTTSQIGTGIVYIITFFFFKFFLGQSVVPALLNLVRLTCDTGLTRLPQNLAPKIYLSCLLMFVVTLQGIFTGNLATLLTTTISYPNVETRGDIGKLGYTVYTKNAWSSIISQNPLLDAHVIEIPESEACQEHLFVEPLVACIVPIGTAIIRAGQYNLHVSRETILTDYTYYMVRSFNMFRRRLDQIITSWVENGIRRNDPIWEVLHRKHVVDDDVRSNVERRVMTLGDLGFAFVILGVGLIFSTVCFIGEIVICRIRLKIEKRRNRHRARLAWGVNKKKFSLFPSLNLASNARRLLSKLR